jgi:Holliday junction resolvase RusA-like endonuclease
VTAPILTVVVLGHPAPQGSKHGRPIYTGRGDTRNFTGRVAQVESSKHLPPWRDAVRTDARLAIEKLGDAWPGTLCEPVGLRMVFTFVRPKSHYRTGRNAHLLRDSAPVFPHGKPDLSKLARSTEDALTDAGVWLDDSLVVAYGRLAKVYANNPWGFDPESLTVSGAVIRVHLVAEPATHPTPGAVVRATEES